MTSLAINQLDATSAPTGPSSTQGSPCLCPACLSLSLNMVLFTLAMSLLTGY